MTKTLRGFKDKPMKQDTLQTQELDVISSLVITALKQEKLSGLPAILEKIGEAVNAYGCILWEVTPNTKLLRFGRLFGLAEWFKDGKTFKKHDIPIVGSANGLALLDGEPKIISNIAEDERTYKYSPVIIGTGLKHMCAVPLSLKKNKSLNATIAVYRNNDVPFNQNDMALVRRMAALIPDLYRAIQDRMSRSLIYDVNEIFYKMELEDSAEGKLKFERVRRGLEKIATKVSATFRCIETSIFLETRSSLGTEFELAATTWPQWSLYKKEKYRAENEEGITGWVLANNKAVDIFDLTNFQEESASLQKRYPNIIWKDSLNIKKSVSEILKLQSIGDRPPLSFMAAPISRGNKVFGVIRCCTAKEGPYYFEARAVTLLKFVAAQISRFWSNWLIRREKAEEDEGWVSLVKGIGQLNSFVQREFDEISPNEHQIFDEALRVTADVITGSDVLDLRLLDSTNRHELYFSNTLGKAWEMGSPTEIQERLNKKFSINEESSSGRLAFKVFKEKKAQMVKDAKLEGYESKTFPETKRIIVAPIGVKKEVIGCLDIRDTGGILFPRHSLRIAELLGQQLGLYKHLAEVIAKLRHTETELKRQEKIRQRVFEDLSHQLKTPVAQISVRTNMLLQGTLPPELERRTKILRGLSRKAQRVTTTTGFFKELARHEEVRLAKNQLKRLHPDNTRIRLIEAASDNELSLEQYRQIVFNVNRDGFDVLARNTVMVDIDLFEQAVNCLLDNAGKYSFSNTRVEISVGIARKDPAFYIEVKNKGFPIKPDEIDKCKDREWRGDSAKHVTGEGSGIGLWAVDQIMKAHNGSLIIHATIDHVTQIRLVFRFSV